MSKLLVGLGDAGGERTDTVEIIDLTTDFKTCKNLPNFPSKLSGSFGGLELQVKIHTEGGGMHDGGL
jgi:hypothetical protein